jgi:hypothetical protein
MWSAAWFASTLQDGFAAQVSAAAEQMSRPVGMREALDIADEANLSLLAVVGVMLKPSSSSPQC